jgi:hypothetical protein
VDLLCGGASKREIVATGVEEDSGDDGREARKGTGMSAGMGETTGTLENTGNVSDEEVDDDDEYASTDGPRDDECVGEERVTLVTENEEADNGEGVLLRVGEVGPCV